MHTQVDDNLYLTELKEVHHILTEAPKQLALYNQAFKEEKSSGVAKQDIDKSQRAARKTSLELCFAGAASR